MKGVLLIDMGGANTPKELKLFLSRMFNDPFILPFGKSVRHILSFIISNTRYKKSWKKYELIGGSPIIDATRQTMTSLQQQLGEKYTVKMAFSYSSPLIKESLNSFLMEGINEITVIPLYPQASISTTSSVEKDVNDVVSKNIDLKVKLVKEFYYRDTYVNYWSNLITNHIKINNYTHPYLLFSAHSIPQYLAEKGDTYPQTIEQSALLIAKKTGLAYQCAYQSKMTGKWMGPDTKESLKKLDESGIDEIVIVPISFVNENLETMYDLDHDILPFAKNILNIQKISRVKIPVADTQFINLLSEIVTLNN